MYWIFRREQNICKHSLDSALLSGITNTIKIKRKVARWERFLYISGYFWSLIKHSNKDRLDKRFLNVKTYIFLSLGMSLCSYIVAVEWSHDNKVCHWIEDYWTMAANTITPIQKSVVWRKFLFTLNRGYWFQSALKS